MRKDNTSASEFQDNGAPFLLVFSSLTSYKLLRYTGIQFQKFGRRVIFLYSQGQDETFDAVRQDADVFGWRLECFDVEKIQDTGVSIHQSKVYGIRFGLIKLLARIFARSSFQAHRKAVTAGIALLRKLDPKVIVVSEDGVSGPLAILAAARSCQIPVVDIPYGCATREDFDKDLDRKERIGELNIASGLSGLFLKNIMPQWVKKEGKHIGAIMFSPRYILSAEAAGISLADSWIVHGGLSNRLYAENKIALKQYFEEGIDKKKIVLTGSPYCDELYYSAMSEDKYSSSLRKPRFVDRGVCRIIVSWPPSYHETFVGGSEFSDYQEMTFNTFSMLKNLSNCTVTVSVHPAASNIVQEIAEELGLQIAADHIVSLLPKNDILLAYYSTVVRWALAAGKIVVNYDAYKIGLTLFDPAPGFVNHDRLVDVQSSLESLSSEGTFSQLAMKQIAVADDWGLLDGSCSQRIMEDIDGMGLDAQSK